MSSSEEEDTEDTDDDLAEEAIEIRDCINVRSRYMLASNFNVSLRH